MIDGSNILHALGEKASASQFRRMIDGIDKDGGGLITFDEFMEPRIPISRNPQRDASVQLSMSTSR